MPVTWTPEKNHTILLHLLKRTETKDIGLEELAALFEGATVEAVRQQIFKLRREAKLIAAGTEVPVVPGATDGSPGVGKAAPAKGRARPKPVADGMAAAVLEATAPIVDKADGTVAKESAGKPRGRAKKVGGGGAGAGTAAGGKGGRGGGKGKRKRVASVEEGYGGDIEEEAKDEHEEKKIKVRDAEAEMEPGLVGVMESVEYENDGEGEDGSDL